MPQVTNIVGGILPLICYDNRNDLVLGYELESRAVMTATLADSALPQAATNTDVFTDAA